jgi:lipopolysaccharide/colanic/teichoic acid biosynthesis glycosyltransferase
MTKRAFDIVVAACAIVFLSPLLVGVAVACMVANGPGPVLFRQARVGRFGRIFHIHKFRTMRDAPGAAVTSDGDSRITRLGTFLRATKLDELPQLFDVLAGSMSLVGPRPELPVYVDCWPAGARRQILSVRPGITDPASIAYRHESSELARAADPESYYLATVLPRKVAMYVRYVEQVSLREDLRLLFQTVGAVFTPGRPDAIASSPDRLASYPVSIAREAEEGSDVRQPV